VQLVNSSFRRCLVFAGTCAALLAGGSVNADAPPVRVGLIFSYGIIGGTAGRTVDAGIAAWVKEHGDTVNGRKIVLVRRDDGGMSPDNARRLAQELIVSEHADLLAGITFTPNAIAAGAVSTEAKVPLAIMNAGTSNIMAKNPYMSRFGFTTAQIAVPLAKWMVQNGVKTAISMYQDYGPGIEAGSAFGAAYAAAGGSVVDEIKIPVNNLDYSAYVQRIKDAHPQGVFVFINASGGGAQFVKAAHVAGLDKLGIRIFSPSDIVDENDLDPLGEPALGLIAASNYTTTHDSALNRQFVADFREAYAAQNGGAAREATEVGVAAYDIMHAIALVVAAQAGAIDADKALQTIRGLKFESPRGPIAIDPDTRDIVQNVYIRRAQRVGGKVRYVEIATIPMVKDPIEK
jgi:branched-chain amino acid transport system substrate-binding protein